MVVRGGRRNGIMVVKTVEMVLDGHGGTFVNPDSCIKREL